MFCPACADEFRDGFTRCPDCAVDLVVNRPRRPLERSDSLGRDDGLDDRQVELFWTSDPRVLRDAAAVLGEASIPCWLDGLESLTGRLRWQSRFRRGAEPMAARLFVPASARGRAKDLLDEAGIDPAGGGLPKAIRLERGPHRLPPDSSQPKRLRDHVADFFWNVLDVFVTTIEWIFRLIMSLAVPIR